jgi:hypothetical protein
MRPSDRRLQSYTSEFARPVGASAKAGAYGRMPTRSATVAAAMNETKVTTPGPAIRTEECYETHGTNEEPHSAEQISIRPEEIPQHAHCKNQN